MLDIIPDNIHRIVDVTAWALPAYCGYCESQGAHINPEVLNSLLYGPTAVKATATSVECGIVGAGTGAAAGIAFGSLPQAAIAGGLVGALVGASSGATIGTVTGGTRSLISYFVGKVAGELMK